MPLTRRVQVYIDAEASEALDRLARRFGGLTAAIEAALMYRAADLEVYREVKSPTPERKAKLKEIIEEALPQRSPEEILASAQAQIEGQRNTYCPHHRPKWCAADCKHRVAA